MIHEAKNLTPDQRLVVEGLLGHSVATDDNISICTVSRQVPAWLQNLWDGAKERGVDQLTPEEIDTEITAVRNQRRIKQR